MAKTVNASQSNYTNPGRETCQHVRRNPVTGELDWFFPLEITNKSLKETAQTLGYEIGRSRLGYRCFDAVMVPCKETAVICGREKFIDTPSDVQHRRYLDYCQDELAAQDAAKQDGRCNIPDGRGGVKRCPCRVPNPEYVSGGDQPKTIPVRCEGCKYEPFRQAHTFVEISALDSEDENGDIVPYEPAAPEEYFGGDRFLRLRREFLAFVKSRNPKLAELAALLTQEYSKTEAAETLATPRTTVNYQAKKLLGLAKEFLDTMIDF